MTHLELFAGIGGFRRTLELLTNDGIMDFESVGFSEIDAKAILTYTSNYNTEGEVFLGDIVAFTANTNNIANLPDFDFLSGGFPCQTFSMMGSKAGFEEERGQLFFRIIDILAVKHPRYVLLENVKNLYTHDGGNTFARIVHELELQGYNVISNIFNTQDYHLPQKRRRVLIFATLDQLPEGVDELFTPKNVAALFDEHYLELGVSHYDTVLDVLAHQVHPKYFLSERIKPTILANGSANFRSRSDINQIIARTLTASMHKMHRACQDNYYSQDFIDTNGSVNPVENMTKEQLARLPIRKLTPEEAFMLQGFPATFAVNGRHAGVADGALYKQAGNAVSINTIYAVLYFLITNNIMTE
ncbi:MAG: DNA (cytosine-5-)-methyltransferase [Prevotellaceae bacterium]|nr:DNA (cytosine-5-)-methyltransferase [Prevotellaceae bacterium]